MFEKEFKDLLTMMDELVNPMEVSSKKNDLGPAGFFPPITSLGMLRTDIEEDGDELVYTMDVPGFKKEDIAIDVEDGLLKVTAEKTSETKSDDAYIRRERVDRKLSRCFRIFDDVKPEDVKAKMENGVLEIRIPKPADGEEKNTKVNIL